MTSSTELAWCAGFFDGEGSTFVASRRGKHLRVHIGISQKDDRVLQRFAAAVGEGTIYSCKPRELSDGSLSPRHLYSVNGTPKVRFVLELLWPYLDVIKRQQARAAFERIGEPIGSN